MGNNIVTSLDKDFQKAIADALSEGMNKSGAKAGSVIALNPKNGNVLGMVSLPSFDNNLFAKGISSDKYSELLNDPAKPLFNRSVSGTYPSGSVIKPVIAAAALQENVVNINTTVLSTGSLVLKNQYNPEIEYVFPDWKPGGHGRVNVIGAIANSVNTYFYYIGGGYESFKGLGASRLEKYLKLFGLGPKLGIDLPGEVDGLVPTPEWKEEVQGETWYTADNYQMSIGQGNLLVTTLQVVSYTSTIANGGTLYKPRVVQKIVDQKDSLVKEYVPEIIRKDFVSRENIDIVKQGMRETVISGSARSLNSLSFEVAGKTGTAQYGPNNSKQHAWFSAFAPYENPEIALVVLLEGGGEGSSYAVPVARKILEYYFNNK
jgi:penicillin-binding protein 2